MIQCKGITVRKTQCKRKAVGGEYCNLHKYNERKNIENKEIVYNISFEALGSKSLGECVICCDNVYEASNSKLECGHIFHLKCVKELRNPTCPCCREKLKSKLLTDKDIQLIEERHKTDYNNENRIRTTDYLNQRALYNSDTESSDEEEFVPFEQHATFMGLSVSEYLQYVSMFTGVPINELYRMMI